MTRTPFAGWLELAHDSSWLWAESMMVIGMRVTDMMTGHGSAQETLRMVTEMVRASAELTAKLASGGVKTPQHAAQIAVGHYRRRVTANRKRLSRRKRG